MYLRDSRWKHRLFYGSDSVSGQVDHLQMRVVEEGNRRQTFNVVIGQVKCGEFLPQA